VRMRQIGGGPTVEDSIRALVAQLVPENTLPPIDPTACLRAYNVEGVEAASLPYAGRLIMVGERYRIQYSAGMSKERRRFTIAHELCHAIFANSGRGWPRTGSELEEICERFAAELLMPRWAIEHAWSSHGCDVTSFRDTADKFAVSWTALACRLAEFGLAIVLREEAGVWRPLPRVAKKIDWNVLMNCIPDAMQCPGVLPGCSTVRRVVGPQWGSGRLGLLLPMRRGTEAGGPMHESPELTAAELAVEMAAVRAAIDRGLARYYEQAIATSNARLV
jgi:IrrE N-terminal-like domain